MEPSTSAVCSPSCCWDKPSGPLLPSLVPGTENSFEWPSQSQLPLPTANTGVSFGFHPFIAFVNTAVPNVTWKRMLAKLMSTGKRLELEPAWSCTPGICHDASQGAFKQENQWAPNCMGIRCARLSLDICRVYRCVDTISVIYCFNLLSPSGKMFPSLIYFSSCTETEQTNPMDCSGLKHGFSSVPEAFG